MTLGNELRAQKKANALEDEYYKIFSDSQTIFALGCPITFKIV
jgi:hypothetical protein